MCLEQGFTTKEEKNLVMFVLPGTSADGWDSSDETDVRARRGS